MTKKTYKRETAIGCLVFLAGVSLYALAGDDPAIIEARVSLVAALVLPVFIFASGMFGIDWMGKHTDIGRQQPIHQPPEDFPHG